MNQMASDKCSSNAQNSLRSLDFMVMRSQLKVDASPFLGLALGNEKIAQARKALRGGAANLNS